MLGQALAAFLAAMAPMEVGSKSCAPCHAAVVRAYQASPMSRTSGHTGDKLESFASAEFVTPAYKVDFAGSALSLEWFLGSGRLGRSYLFSRNGFLFQSPLSYYRAQQKWDKSPGFRGMDFTRPVESACLQCHASRLQPVAGTLNGFRNPPFLENGVSCERCHGPGSDHVRAGGKGGIVNPSKLAPPRRDSVCAQCHLTGAARLARAGPKAYTPGALLSDSIAVFTWSSTDSGLNATSHFEKLSRSACAQASGERLWCGTCHDPHGKPITLNTKCAACHQPAQCQRGPDCASCHMPKSQVHSMDHVAFTDHSIPRRPAPPSEPLRTGLVPFWKGSADAREEALAYSIAAQTEAALRPRAFEMLVDAERRWPKDVAVLAQLAQFYDAMGDEERAMELSERILALDPGHLAATINLGTYRVKRGQVAEAIALWERALAKAPGSTGTRLNLAIAKFQSGDRAGAEAQLLRALEHDPGNASARRMLEEIRSRSR